MAIKTLQETAREGFGVVGPLVFLVRHGESEFNPILRTSTEMGVNPLTAKGRAEAELAAMMLKYLQEVDFIATSPLLRTQQTAEIISKHIKGPIIIEPFLIERGMGKYNGYTFKSEEELKNAFLEEIRLGYPNTESWESMQNRAKQFKQKVAGKKIGIAVSHVDPIKPTLSTYMGNCSEMEMKGYKILNGSVTVLDFGKSDKSGIHGISLTLPMLKDMLT